MKVLQLGVGAIGTVGVLPPEMLDPEPILALLQELGVSVHKKESAL
jgi:hypothetical protein